MCRSATVCNRADDLQINAPQHCLPSPRPTPNSLAVFWIHDDDFLFVEDEADGRDAVLRLQRRDEGFDPRLLVPIQNAVNVDFQPAEELFRVARVYDHVGILLLEFTNDGDGLVVMLLFGPESPAQGEFKTDKA